MNAGQELDILIAEKVMGLEVVKTEYGKIKKRTVCSIGEPNYHDYSGDLQLSNPLPSYSEDLAAAMEVFQKLRESHKYCCLKIVSDYNYVWSISLTKVQPWPRDKDAEGNDPYKHEPSVYVTEESLPLAICLAALKTIE